MSGRVLKGTVVIDPTVVVDDSSVDDAVAEAYEQGRQEGEAAATGRLEEAVERLTELLATTSAETADAVVAAQRLDAETVVSLAADLVGWYLDRMPSVDRAATIDEAVAQAVGSFEHDTSLTLHVAPEVADHLRPPSSVEVLADPALGPTDFRLQASDGAVERSWADTIERLTPALVQAVTGGTDEQ